jgi:hypothetical protein
MVYIGRYGTPVYLRTCFERVKNKNLRLALLLLDEQRPLYALCKQLNKLRQKIWKRAQFLHFPQGISVSITNSILVLSTGLYKQLNPKEHSKFLTEEADLRYTQNIHREIWKLRSPARPGSRWQDDIKTDLRDIWYKNEVECSGSGQGPAVNTVINLSPHKRWVISWITEKAISFHVTIKLHGVNWQRDWGFEDICCH